MKKTVLITAPSLDPNKNVSGISSIVTPLLELHPDVFRHLQVGTYDGKKGFRRFTSFVTSMLSLLGDRLKGKTDIVHINTAANPLSLIRDLFLVKVSRLLLYKVVVQFHGGEWLTNPNADSIFWRSILRSVAYSANSLIVLGKLEASVLRKSYGISRDIQLLPNFVPDAYFDTKTLVKRQHSIIFLGRLVSSKGVEQLPTIVKHVIQHIPDAHFAICGDGPMREMMLSQLSTLPVKNWTYYGVVHGNEKLELISSSKVLMMPSTSGEGMPIAMLEAMACGTVPVVTNLGAISDVIEDGVSGVLCSPHNQFQYSQALCATLLSQKFESLSHQCRTRARDFSSSTYVENIYSIYEDVRSSKSKSFSR